MLSPKYRNVIQLPQDVAEYINEYNDFRNSLHFNYMGKIERGIEPIKKLKVIHEYAIQVMHPFAEELREQHEEALRSNQKSND